MNKLLSTLLAGLMALSSTAQAEKISLERIYSDPSLSGKTPKNLTVSPDGKRATYIQSRTDDYNRYDLWE